MTVLCAVSEIVMLLTGNHLVSQMSLRKLRAVSLPFDPTDGQLPSEFSNVLPSVTSTGILMIYM